MQKIKKVFGLLKGAPRWFMKASIKKKLIVIAILVGLGWIMRGKIVASTTPKVAYQTSTVEKGTLITTISASGTITSGNNTSISTKVSGTVDQVYVTNGDTVTKGQKIATITLDDYAQEREAAAWVAYLEATENAKEAKNNKALADISMWEARQDVLDAQDAYDDMIDDDTNPATHEVYTDGERMIITKTLDQSRLAFDVAEAKYLNSDADITNYNAKVASALRGYQENSSTIVAPASGTISDLSLASGLVINSDSQTSSTSGATIVSAQTIGKVSNPSGQLQAEVSLSELDVINVKANQKVTLTLDAYEDLTFTGRVLSVDTSGSSSQGVTTYPVVVLLDSTDVEIYPNMAVTAEIITDIETDALLVPSIAVNESGDISTVQIMKNGEPVTVQVEVGKSNDTQTVILSGIDEGETIITSTINSSVQSTGSESSVFGGSMSGFGTGGGPSGGQVRGVMMSRPGGF